MTKSKTLAQLKNSIDRHDHIMSNSPGELKFSNTPRQQELSISDIFRRKMNIFLLPEEQYKRNGIQTFRDSPSHEKSRVNEDNEIIRKKFVAGLTIPIIHSNV